MFIALVAVAFVAAAVAAGASAKGKPPVSGTNCRPNITVILTGTLTANGAAAPSTLSVNVTGGNHFAAAYKKATQPISVGITTSTAINRQGDHNPADLVSGDKINIRARACRADLANGATSALTATRVTANPAS